MALNEKREQCHIILPILNSPLEGSPFPLLRMLCEATLSNSWGIVTLYSLVSLAFPYPYHEAGRVRGPLVFLGHRWCICCILPARIEKLSPSAISQFALGARNILLRIERGAQQYFFAHRKPSSSSSGLIFAGLKSTCEPSYRRQSFQP